MSASVVYPQRVAMISMHTSPLATPGVGDAGGLNVYVGEVARRLGERGLKVDVFTRAAGDGRPAIVEVNEHTRVIHVPAGPAGPVAKEELLDLVARLRRAAGRRDGALRPDPQPLLAVRHGRLAGSRRGTASRWCTPCTPWPG